MPDKYKQIKTQPMHIVDTPKGMTRCGCPTNANLVERPDMGMNNQDTIASLDEEELIPGEVSMAPNQPNPKLQTRNQETLDQMKKKVQSSLNTKQMSSAIQRRVKGGDNAKS